MEIAQLPGLRRERLPRYLGLGRVCQEICFLPGGGDVGGLELVCQDLVDKEVMGQVDVLAALCGAVGITMEMAAVSSMFIGRGVDGFWSGVKSKGDAGHLAGWGCAIRRPADATI